MSQVIIYDLQSPITIDGKTIKKINLDLDKIDGQALLELPSMDSVNTPKGIMQLAAKSAEMIPDDLATLKGPDAFEVMSIIRVFLHGNLEKTQYADQLKEQNVTLEK
ncbi:hypothetical protein [Niallia sp. 01092]|uniref:hypothetical protein n=1 Tax=unclassified Niallia TaxID=2837522 RepID=UPI003FD4929F